MKSWESNHLSHCFRLHTGKRKRTAAIFTGRCIHCGIRRCYSNILSCPVVCDKAPLYRTGKNETV